MELAGLGDDNINTDKFNSTSNISLRSTLTVVRSSIPTYTALRTRYDHIDGCPTGQPSLK